MNGLLPLGALPLMNFSSKPSAGKADQQQIIELIKYQLPLGAGKNRVRDYYKNALIPALNRIGVDNVGVFSVRYGMNKPTLYALHPHADMASFLNYQHRLMDDAVFVDAAQDVLKATLADPAYTHKETMLYKAFSGMPQVQPPASLQGKDRIFEFRIYQSHSFVAGQKKIDMFNEGGEIAIFKKTGLEPVFFGEALAGPLMPNLTYMLVFENMTERDKHWDEFRNHPDWKKLSGDEQYKDTVSNISDIILSPFEFSQI